MKCDECGGDISIGTWPFCGGDPSKHERSRFEVDHFTPYWDEMLTEDGVMVSSARQRRKIMDANGVEYHKNKFETKIARGATGKALFFDMKRG